ncbi:hypothetical protein NBRC116493_21470 [Aurantivibrio infirmus]
MFANSRTSLGTRIFIMCALLLLLSLGMVVGFTYKVSQSIADESLSQSLSDSLVLQTKFRELNQRDLENVVQTFASDPNFGAYIQEAINASEDGEIDVDSISDLIAEKRDNLGLDFIIILDEDGYVITHSERPDWQSKDLAAEPLVEPVIEDLFSVVGSWIEEETLYQAVGTPLVVDFSVAGYVVAGVRVDESFATSIQEIGGSDIVYVLENNNNFITVASTLGTLANEELITQLAPQNFTDDLALDNEELKIFIQLGGASHIAQVQSLAEPLENGTRPLLLTISSPAKYQESYQEIIQVVIIAGLVSIFLALILTFIFSSRTLKPVKQLAAAAENAARGNFSDPINLSGRDELTRLGAAINHLLSNLREKQDIQNYLTQISHLIPEDQPNKTASFEDTAQATRIKSLTILAIDSTPALESKSKASVLKSNIEKISNIIREQIAKYQGEIFSEASGQVICAFNRASGSLAAYAASIEINKLVDPIVKSSQGKAIKFAITDGNCIIGEYSLSDTSKSFVLGNPTKQATRLLLEANEGDCITSSSIYEKLKGFLDKNVIQVLGIEGAITQRRYCGLPLNQSIVLHSPELRAELAKTTTPNLPTDNVKFVPGAMIANRYEIISTIGSGSMGMVFKSLDHELDELVAIKLLKKDIGVDKKTLDNMKSEIRLARQITHQNILRTFDIGDISGLPFITMEYVRGLTLRSLMQNAQKLPYSAGLLIARQLCEGLSAVHSVGVLHRDIKPENIMVELNGNVKLMDFGIARSVRQDGKNGDEKGFFIGTPRYASPEQMTGKNLTESSDIYSCGVVLTEIFTGYSPIKGQTFTQISESHIQMPPIPPSELWPNIPRDLEAILLRCLEKQASDRFPSVNDLLKALNELQA